MGNPMMMMAMKGMNPMMAMKGMKGKKGGDDGGMDGGWNGMKGMKGYGKGPTPFKITMDKILQVPPAQKIFVQGIPEGSRWKDLEKAFAEAGHKPVFCEVMNQGRGVCTFGDEEKTIAAIAAMDQATMGTSTLSCDAWQA